MWFLKFLVVIGIATLSSASNGPKRLFNQQSDEEGQLITPFTDPFDGIDYRLPNDTKPIHYDIWLSTDVHRGNFTFEGRVSILIEAIENASAITLHYRQITITNVRLMRDTGGTIHSSAPFELIPSTEFLIIRPTQQLVQALKYIVEISYTGVLRSDDAGFYRSSYVNPQGDTVWLATTQFQATDARHAFPW